MVDQLIEQRLAVIEAVVVRLEERLFGNGQPGEINQMKQRIANLEAWFWRAAGAAGVLLGLLQFFNHSIARLFTK